MCDLNYLHVNTELLFIFFLNFSRFEYALKRSGFIKKMGRDREEGVKDASPDWNKFVCSIKANFDKDKNRELAQAVDFIWENPPWKEVVNSRGELLFESPAYDHKTFDLSTLLIFVRRVRNNLFHGGKHGNIVVDRNTARTERLLKESLIILDACLGLNSDVNDKYSEAVI